MNSAVVYDNSVFKSNLDVAGDNTKRRLREEFETTKLRVVKLSLESKGIAYDSNVTSLSELDKSLRDNLNDAEYKGASDIIGDVSDNFEALLKDLESGSTNAFTKFVNNVGKLTKPIAKASAYSLAGRTVVALAPTVGSKLAVTGAMTAGTVFKLAKNRKEGIVIDQMYECNKMLQELEVSRDEKGEITDTRFTESIQSVIRRYLVDNDIVFADLGYLSLREQIYSLDLEKKKELCNIINNNMGNRIDVNGRLEKVGVTFFDKVRENFKKVSDTAVAAVGAAGVINSVDPAIIATPVNSLLVGTAVGQMTESGLIGTITGATAQVLGVAAEYIPIVGEYVGQTYALENLALAGVAGVGAGLVSVAATGVVNVVKNIWDKFSTQADKKKIMKFDGEKYAEENKTEFAKMKAHLESKENSLEEQALIDLVYGFGCDEGMKFKSKPRNVYELTAMVNGLDGDSKKKIAGFYGKLINYNRERNDLVGALVKAGDIVTTLTVLGLSGLSIYDIVKDGQFLPELSANLFSEVPNNIYLQIPSKVAVDGILKEGMTMTETQLAMIEDIDKAKSNYETLTGMQTTEVVENTFENIPEHFGNSWENGLENVGAEWENFWSNAGAWWNSLWSGEEFVWHEYDPINTVVSGNGSTVYTSTDRAAITEMINGLSESELIDLAYYYNGNPTDTEIHGVIGDVLNNKLPEISDAITAYNEKMNMINSVSEGTEVVGAVVAGVGNLEDNKTLEK